MNDGKPQSDAARMLQLQREHQAQGKPASKAPLYVLLGFVGLVAIILAIGIIGPMLDPKGFAEIKARQQAEAAAQASTDAANARLEATKKASEQAAEKKAREAGNLSLMSGFYDDVMSTAKGCDAPAKAMADTAQNLAKGTATIYDGSIAAREAKRGCEAVMQQFQQMSPPQGFEGDARKQAAAAIERCGTAAMIKKQAAEALEEIYDGDSRPSKLADFKESGDNAQIAQLACVASLFSAASELGVDLSKLPQIGKN